MSSNPTRAPLSTLLSQALIAFTLEFDRCVRRDFAPSGSDESPPSLALWSNVLQFVGFDGVEKRRLPALAGLSKPAVQSMVSCLERHGWITIELERGDKPVEVIRLTPRGLGLWARWETTMASVENDWRERFGHAVTDRLRSSLETIGAQLDDTLPHYPMPLPHRGGSPTGH